MTVAAVILCDSAGDALADAAGRPAARRTTETAWAGGAVPIVVVSADPDGRVALSLSGSSAILADPAPASGGLAGQMARGIQVALEAVAETSAALIWPAHLTWVDAETVTTLIEAHGLDGLACLRPTWQGAPGWPVLLPVTYLTTLTTLTTLAAPEALLAALEVPEAARRDIDLGDAGILIGRDTPIEQLPIFEGPSMPVAPPPEWGAAAAEESDDSPLEGPTRAPYPSKG